MTLDEAAPTINQRVSTEAPMSGTPVPVRQYIFDQVDLVDRSTADLPDSLSDTVHPVNVCLTELSTMELLIRLSASSIAPPAMKSQAFLHHETEFTRAASIRRA